MTDQRPVYTLYAAFAGASGDRRLPDAQRAASAAAARAALDSTDATVRGAYTVSGYRHDTDLLLWLVGPTADGLQDALLALRRTVLGHALDPFWSALGVHRDANK